MIIFLGNRRSGMTLKYLEMIQMEKELLHNAIKVILTEQMDMMKQITDKALEYIPDKQSKLLFLNDCERIAITSVAKLERLQKELGV